MLLEPGQRKINLTAIIALFTFFKVQLEYVKLLKSFSSTVEAWRYLG